MTFRVTSHILQCLCRYLNFVSELFDLVDGGVVLVGELPQLLLAPLRHLLQVGALILRVTEGALQANRNEINYLVSPKNEPPASMWQIIITECAHGMYLCVLPPPQTAS